MQRVFYMGGVADMGDRTSVALLAYGRALANRGLADVVDLPIITSGGPQRAQFLIGPASMLLSTPIAGSQNDFTDRAAAADLERRTAKLLPEASSWNGLAEELDEPAMPPFDDFS